MSSSSLSKSLLAALGCLFAAQVNADLNVETRNGGGSVAGPTVFTFNVDGGGGTATATSGMTGVISNQSFTGFTSTATGSFTMTMQGVDNSDNYDGIGTLITDIEPLDPANWGFGTPSGLLDPNINGFGVESANFDPNGGLQPNLLVPVPPASESLLEAIIFSFDFSGLTLSGSQSVVFSFGTVLANESFRIYEQTGAMEGTVVSSTDTTVTGLSNYFTVTDGTLYALTDAGWDGGNSFRVSNMSIDIIGVVPEPSSYALISGVLVMLFAMQRRRKS